MRSSSLRLAFLLSAVTLAACAGDQFEEPDAGSGGKGGSAGSAQAGRAGSGTAGSKAGGSGGSAGTSFGGSGGTGGSGGNAGTQATGGNAGEAAAGTGGNAGEGGANVGGASGSTGVGGATAGAGGAAGTTVGNAGASGGAGTSAAGSSGAAGTSAGGSSGSGGATTAGGSGGVAGQAGASTGGAAGAALGGAGGQGGANPGGNAGTAGMGGGGGAGESPWGPGKCDPLGAFTAVAPMEGPMNSNDSGAQNSQAWFDASQSVLVWTRGGTGAELYFTEADALSGAWGTPDDCKGTGSDQTELFPSLLPSLNKIYFTSNRPTGGATWRLYVNAKAGGGLGDWPFADVTPVAIPGRKANDREFGGTVSSDDTTLYFASTRRVDNAAYNPADLDLYVLTGLGTANAAVSPIASVNTTTLEESHATISPDQRILYYATRAAAPAGSPYDIHVATRLAASQPFGAPVRLDSLSTDGSETPSWISENYCTVLFTRTVGGITKIWQATRTVP